MTENRHPDIFDRFMHLRLMRPLEPFFQKYREVILYILFGGITTVVSWVTFWLFGSVLGIHELIANVISWIFAVTTAYLTNRVWVFDSRAAGVRAITAEAVGFFLGRALTLAFEEAIIALFVTWLGFNEMAVKIIATIGVLILNYIISKLIVFRKGHSE